MLFYPAIDRAKKEDHLDKVKDVRVWGSSEVILFLIGFSVLDTIKGGFCTGISLYVENFFLNNSK